MLVWLCFNLSQFASIKMVKASELSEEEFNLAMLQARSLQEQNGDQGSVQLNEILSVQNNVGKLSRDAALLTKIAGWSPYTFR